MNSRNRLLVGAVFLVAACTPRQAAPPVGRPVPDPEAFVADLRLSGLPERLEQVTFDWSLDEGGSRVRGRGVVRVDAPQRVRLDLFGTRGETYLSAALVDGQYRFPNSFSPPIEPPSPALLWAAMGILSPPADAVLEGVSADSAAANLRFRSGEDLFVYGYAADHTGSLQLTSLERAGPRGVKETVSIRYDQASNRPASSRYRNWEAFRDLSLEVQEINGADSFPSDIWLGTGR